jgi:hypothetical protein
MAQDHDCATLSRQCRPRNSAAIVSTGFFECRSYQGEEHGAVSATGNVKEKRAPPPGARFSAAMDPPKASMMDLQMASPIPIDCALSTAVRESIAPAPREARRVRASSPVRAGERLVVVRLPLLDRGGEAQDRRGASALTALQGLPRLDHGGFRRD